MYKIKKCSMTVFRRNQYYLQIYTDVPTDEVSKILVDGKVLGNAYYNISWDYECSIRISREYIDGCLPLGPHKVEIDVADGTLLTHEFTVKSCPMTCFNLKVCGTPKGVADFLAQMKFKFHVRHYEVHDKEILPPCRVIYSVWGECDFNIFSRFITRIKDLRGYTLMEVCSQLGLSVEIYGWLPQRGVFEYYFVDQGKLERSYFIAGNSHNVMAFCRKSGKYHEGMSDTEMVAFYNEKSGMTIPEDAELFDGFYFEGEFKEDFRKMEDVKKGRHPWKQKRKTVCRAV